MYVRDISRAMCEGCCPVDNIAHAPQPGELCEPDEPDVLASLLNRPSLSLWLFVSIGRWFATNRVCLMCVAGRKDDWTLVKAGSVVSFPQEGAPVECRMFAPLFAPDLINRSSDLLCPYSDRDMPSLFVSSEFFDRVLSQPGTPGGGYLVVADVRFDVTGPVSSGNGDSVRAGSYLMASGVTDTDNRFPLT